MSDPESRPPQTPAAENPLQRAADVANELFVIFSDRAHMQRIVDHPDIDTAALEEFNRARGAFDEAQARHKRNPADAAMQTGYLAAGAELLRVGETLLGQIKAAGIEATKH